MTFQHMIAPVVVAAFLSAGSAFAAVQPQTGAAPVQMAALNATLKLVGQKQSKALVKKSQPAARTHTTRHAAAKATNGKRLHKPVTLKH